MSFKDYEMNVHVELLESIGRLGLALFLGSAIGFERQWHQKMAGLRTNALVALGSCGYVVFSAMVGQGDPTRSQTDVRPEPRKAFEAERERSSRFRLYTHSRTVGQVPRGPCS
jgi:hypothetical protein